MNILTVTTKAGPSPKEFDVFWANGVQKQGIVRVMLPREMDDDLVAAELTALHHLLVRKAIFGEDRAGRGTRRTAGGSGDDSDGDRLQLRVSSGQVRKLSLGKSKKEHLAPLVHFLNTRFHGANIVVESDSSWIKPRALEHTESVRMEAVLDDIQSVPTVGQAVISVHAIEQVQRRGNGLSMPEAWQQLRRILQSCDREVVVDEQKRRRDLDRHGHSGRVLYSTLMNWNIVVSAADGAGRSLPVVATAYFEKRSDADLIYLQKERTPLTA